MKRTTIYTGVVFLSSAGALVLEIAAGRLIAPYVGMSLYTWTAIIAVVLAGLSAGHWIGGHRADKIADETSGHLNMLVALGAAAVATLATLPLLHAVAGPLMASGGETVATVVLMAGLLFFLPSLFVGIISPTATKLAIEAAPERAGSVLGRMFAAGALGSILGTLAAGYVFISWIGTTGTVISVAALYAALAAVMTPLSRRGVPMVLALVVPGLGFGAWGAASGAYVSPCDTESDYFCIRIDDYSAETGRDSRLMALDHLVHSINDRHDPELLFSPYIQLVDEVVRRRYGETGPASAYFVGGGGFTLPRAWNAAFPESRIVVAEIDPAVTEAAMDEMWFTPTASVDVVTRDARVALQTMADGRRFDVVFGDAFHDIAVPAHLVTREFNALVAARLNPGGLYALNVVDRARDPRFLYALVKTMKESFASVEVWISTEVTRDDERVTFIVHATDAPSPAAFLESRHGLERSWARWPEDALAARIEKADPPVLTDSFAPVERLLGAGL